MKHLQCAKLKGVEIGVFCGFPYPGPLACGPGWRERASESKERDGGGERGTAFEVRSGQLLFSLITRGEKREGGRERLKGGGEGREGREGEEEPERGARLEGGELPIQFASLPRRAEEESELGRARLFGGEGRQSQRTPRLSAPTARLFPHCSPICPSLCPKSPN